MKSANEKCALVEAEQGKEWIKYNVLTDRRCKTTVREKVISIF